MLQYKKINLNCLYKFNFLVSSYLSSTDKSLIVVHPLAKKSIYETDKYINDTRLHIIT